MAPVIVGSVAAFQVKLICWAETGTAMSPWGTEGGVISGVGGRGLFMVIATGLELAALPAISLATAVRAWLPFETPRVSQVPEYGWVVSSWPKFTPSNLNWTPAMPLVI